MTINLAHVAFTTGEVSHEFTSRTDLAKYAMGAATVKNFFVDYKGALVSRPGLKFVGATRALSSQGKLIRFRATENDYILIFMRNRIHVIQNGSYVLNTIPSPPVSLITSADPAVVVTVGAHGLSSGNLIHITDVVGMPELNGRIFRVANPTTMTFELYHVNNVSFDASTYGPWVSGGTIYSVVEIPTTYAGADVSELKDFQHQNEMWITHPNYTPRKLTYTDAQTWSFDEVIIGNTGSPPTNLTLTPTATSTPDGGVAAAVTSVAQDDTESVIAGYVFEEQMQPQADETTSLLYEWGAVTGAKEYYVYRSLILPVGNQVSAAEELGYVGRAFGTQFVDPYITPDFTKTPPIHTNPFANAGVQYITMTNKGSLYAKTDTVTVSGGSGSGFSGYPVVNAAGEILGVVVLNGGTGYTSPTITFNTSTGSGATATVTLTPASGNNPSVFTRFQQRGIYAGTTNYPMTIWGSRPSLMTNFDVSSITNAGDAYEFTVDAPDINPIRHMIPFRRGLLLMSSSQIDQLEAAGDGSISAINRRIITQVRQGASNVTPEVVDVNVLYTPPQGTGVFELAYTNYTNSFSARNLSTLAPHLLATERKTITRLAYANEPHKLLFGRRKDGRLLTMTYDPDQELYGWAQHYTRGTFRDVAVAEENGRSVVYVIVQRVINGKSIRHIEYFTKRDFTHIEDYVGVDSAISNTLNELDVSSTLTAGTGTGVTLTITSGETPFVSGDVGSILYVLGGKAEITAVPSSASLTLTFIRDVVVDEAQGTLTNSIDVGKHFLGRKLYYGPRVTNVTGLWHLEGEAVSVLADGVESTGHTVTNGELTPALSTAASKITVGLGYKCQIKSLPAASTQVTINGKLRNAYAAKLYLHETKGLYTGADFNNLYEVKARTDTDWDAKSGGRNDIVSINLRNQWDREGVICIEQAQPYPATVLGFALSVEVED